MIICGIKLTHDGGVALIEDGQLRFSVEMEKISGNPRYASLDHLRRVTQALSDFGYGVADVDQFVVDGWHPNHLLHLTSEGQVIDGSSPAGAALLQTHPTASPVTLAGYRHDDLMTRSVGQALGIDYASYSHYAGHVASGYMTSPFARAGQSSYVMCWDGAMVPMLYHVDVEQRTVRQVAQLSTLVGMAYFMLASTQPPFDGPAPFPQSLGLSGKIMAYIANGTPRPDIVTALEEIHRDALIAVYGDRTPSLAGQDETAFHALLAQMRSAISNILHARDPDDVIAATHTYLGDHVRQALVAAVENDGHASRTICLVGGCALNIKWNRAIRESSIFDDVWVPPFPNDSGSAIGAACCELLMTQAWLEWDLYSGPELGDEVPMEDGWTRRPCSVEELARILHNDGQPVLYLQGRAELGPRALGHRSILAPATDPSMKDTLNAIKGREAYRPIAPICLAHAAPEVFEPGIPDPHMLFDHNVRAEWRARVPAICHLDGTARVQTVAMRDEPELFALLSAYERVSGVPLLCNTSANRHGRGFFPDVTSAMRWRRIPRIWSSGHLWEYDD